MNHLEQNHLEQSHLEQSHLELCQGCGEGYLPDQPHDPTVLTNADLPLDTHYCPDCYARAVIWAQRDDLIDQAEVVEIVGNRATYFHPDVGPIVEHALPAHDIGGNHDDQPR